MKQVILFVGIIVICSSWAPSRTMSHADSREHNLSQELKIDVAQLDQDRVDRDAATGEGRPWNSRSMEIHAAKEQSDLIRIHIDEQLKKSFPALPRTQIDRLADQLDSRLLAATTPLQAQRTLASLIDLHTYIVTLDKDQPPSEHLFDRNMKARLSLLNPRT